MCKSAISGVKDGEEVLMDCDLSQLRSASEKVYKSPFQIQKGFEDL